MREERVDILGLQETLKQDFSSAELHSLECGGQFAWCWVPANGHSGGMLLGFRDECFEVGAWRKGVFFISADVYQRNIKAKWCFMLVYGPADHSRTGEFLDELQHEVDNCQLPLVVGGDFNLIRKLADKSNEVVCWPRIRRFNDAIAAMSLRELNRAGARFTWTNNQLDPIRSVLDRVFVTPSWETLFPLCSLSAVTRIGSDHNPLLLDSGEGGRLRTARFFFQTWWFRVAGFDDLVRGKIEGYVLERGPHRCSIEQWQCISRCLRQFLKGWGANLGKEKRDFRADLLRQVAELDSMADSSGLDEEGWALRYHLEDQLVHLDEVEEEYWRQRNRLKWTLQGDSCTAYFHAIANGRRRKCMIPRLRVDGGEIDDQKDLMDHIYQFYSGLMGSRGEERAFSLAPDLWAEPAKISPEENLSLELTFTSDAIYNDCNILRSSFDSICLVCCNR
jgi:exonuclease III